MSISSKNHSDKKNKQYRFNLQDSSYYISLNITKKKHLSDPDLKFEKYNLNDEFNMTSAGVQLKSEKVSARPKSRLEKVLDYNDTNIVNHQKKYQFMSSNINAGKTNFLSQEQHQHKYKSSKSLNTTNLNLNLETSTHQNNKFKIEISPVRMYDKNRDTNYESNRLNKFNNNYSNHHTYRDNYSNTKVDIETSNDVKINKFNILPLSSRSNNPQLHRMNEFQFKTSPRKPGK
jgi:hypothetical protein